jgi:hypothetical protein
MSAKAIREFHGKNLVSTWLPSYAGDAKYDLESRVLLISTTNITEGDSTFDDLATANPWVLNTKLVVKPDQLIKRRGKAGLLGVNKTWEEVVEWIQCRMNKDTQVEKVSGLLDHFIVEPFVPHSQSDEYYICIQVSTNMSFGPTCPTFMSNLQVQSFIQVQSFVQVQSSSPIFRSGLIFYLKANQRLPISLFYLTP